MDTQTINRNFTHHPPHGDQVERYQSLRESGRLLALKVNQLCPDSREKSLAIAKLEEAIMWANAAIARKESEEF